MRAEICRHSDVQGAVSLAGEDVDTGPFLVRHTTEFIPSFRAKRARASETRNPAEEQPKAQKILGDRNLALDSRSALALLAWRE